MSRGRAIPRRSPLSEALREGDRRSRAFGRPQRLQVIRGPAYLGRTRSPSVPILPKAPTRMMMSLFRTAVFLLAMLPVTGCARKSTLLQDLQARTAALPGVGVCGTVSGLEIVDAREGVSERDLRIPTLTTRGQRDEVRPPLSDTLRSIIADEVSRRVRGAAEPVAVTVRVTEGVQRFNARLMAEQETVRWAVEVSMKSVHGNVAASGDMETTSQSIDASLKFVNQLSAETLRGTVAQALEHAAQRMLPEARACRPVPVAPTPAAT